MGVGVGVGVGQEQVSQLKQAFISLTPHLITCTGPLRHIYEEIFLEQLPGGPQRLSAPLAAIECHCAIVPIQVIGHHGLGDGLGEGVGEGQDP